ncbi:MULTISPECIES: histone deacetylase [Streptomyces]|uniref:Histone deacetylase n=2 Tax=Streptomyces TaxID=1883 RepID=A0ABS9JLD7_9ACTN|nr:MULTISPECIES: histone deacetylase [Streptomyces]MCE0447739.1 histone deacetylase [Streptomyces tricolor]MCG0066380.1 histone deacetylase [Streptomyces tricolor]OYP16369.1 histone deacetylase [Streptomyces sp. FBKL.4005]
MKALPSIDPTLPLDWHPEHVWYTSYGSNTHLDRLAAYLRGGRLPGAAREYPGCRNPAMPARSIPVELTGAMYFATESSVWGGGRAFYDPEVDGRVLARAHLVTTDQFADIAAQEMYRTPGPDLDLDLTDVLSQGRAVLGEGRYERLVCAGQVDGLPVLTFTAPWGIHDVRWVPPSAAYIRFLAAGLLSAGAWDEDAIASYVASCPGAIDHWSPEEIAALLDAGPDGH